MTPPPGPLFDPVRLSKTLVIGALGGALFAVLDMPLAWMMGAMVFTTVTSLTGAALYVPARLRSVMVMILGVLLGSTFTPEIIDRAGDWPLTLAGLAVYLGLLTGILFLYFTRVMGYDPVTAYFSATPGGLNEMVIAGAAMGGDDRTIALVHGSRILLVVLTIPFWFRFTTGVSTSTSSIGPSVSAIGLPDLAVLALCAVAGVAAGKALRLPAYRLVGPMLASAVVHGLGITASAPPYELVAAAQVVVGSAVGARFAGVAVQRVLRTIAASLGSTCLMLAMTVAFAFSLSAMTGIRWPPLVLAYAPGGLAEMSLIALALGIETAFVATHHVVRIGLIVVAAPLVFQRFGRPRGSRPGGEQ